MTAASSVAAPHAGNPRLGAVIASRPLWVALAVTALVTAVRLNGTVDSDVAWQLWIAGRIHAGANLYRDIIETNPPLWFWMALPVEGVATLLHVRIEAVLVVFIGSLVALSLAATDRLLGHIAPGRRALLLGYAALTLAAMPWMHVGQREQIVLIGTLPYVALIAARSEHNPVSPLLAVLIGAGAALGFALKHYFLIVPALLELWLLAGQQRQWRPVRPETVAIVVVGISYAVVLVLLERDFLTTIVPLLRLAYDDFGPPSLKYLLGPFATVGLVTLAFVAAHARLLTGGKAPFAAALLVAAVGFAGVYFIQFKGWTYHTIPLLGCASLALAALLVETEVPPPLLRIVAPALLLLPPVLSFDEQRHPGLPSPDLVRAVSGLPRRTSVGFIAQNTALAWSVTLQHQFAYPSRYNGFWMLDAVQRNEIASHPDPRLTELGRRIVEETAADFRCMPPRRIIVLRPQRGTWSQFTFDPLPFFLRNPDFAELLAHYRPISRTSIEVYELVSPFPPTDPSHCRAGG
jgi:hypothetical protein